MKRFVWIAAAIWIMGMFSGWYLHVSYADIRGDHGRCLIVNCRNEPVAGTIGLPSGEHIPVKLKGNAVSHRQFEESREGSLTVEINGENFAPDCYVYSVMNDMLVVTIKNDRVNVSSCGSGK